MPAPRSLGDYAAAAASLLPRGRVWPRDPGSVVGQVLAALSGAWARLDQAALNLLVDAFPSTANGLLTEWEETLGLPDPCVGPEPSVQLRQASVVERLIASGGQSVPYFTALAAALGFAITIQEFTGTGALANTWQVTAPGSNSTYFNCESSVDEFIDQISADAQVLQCEFARLKPAHTLLLWNFI